jgi:Fic family protein
MILSGMRKFPPFDITPEILKLCQLISHVLGKISGAKRDNVDIILRRVNNIKTIQASLAIEGNTLTIDQITAMFEGKRVIGARRDIEEARNAIDVYGELPNLNPLLIDDLLRAHSLMMKGLITDGGNFRAGGVGVFAGSQVVHMAPSAKMVPKLMEQLFSFINGNTNLPWLIKACVFHYELEFIHPFTDGNGRMGRLWQQLLLMREDRLFEYIPVETLIRKNQNEYYEVLGQCDQEAKSNKFIVFSLEQIYAALISFEEEGMQITIGPKERLAFARLKLNAQYFLRRDYLNIASRDLEYGVKRNILKQHGIKSQTRYSFI